MKTLDSIYKRYTIALDRVTGRGIWMDAGAVRLAMSLAIDDAHDVGADIGQLRQAEINREYANQIQRLAEYLVSCGYDEDALLDCAPYQVVDRTLSAILGLRLTVSDTTADVATWLAAHLDVAVDGATPMAQAVAALNYYHDLVTALRSQLQNQRIEIANNGAWIASVDAERVNEQSTIAHLRAQIAQLEIDLQQARSPVAAPSATIAALIATPDNGNGKSHPAVAAAKTTMPPGLSAIAEEYWQGCERGVHPFRKLPLEIRLEFVQAVLAALAGDGQVTMAEYDTLKPDWMPTASGLPKTFGCSWLDLPSLAPASIKVAA